MQVDDKVSETYHVAHGIVLETKLLREVEEDVLYFLCGHGYLAVCGPCGIVLGGGEGGVCKGGDTGDA